MNDKRIVRNIGYNFALQLFTIVLPLVTTPYLARVLGADGVGEYAYTYSIAQYFVLFGTLGSTVYATRQIAYVQKNPVKLSETFWGIFRMRLVTVFSSLTAYILLFSLWKTEHQLYLLLQSTVIFSNIFDVSWLFMGLEDFKKTVLRSTLIKVFGTASVFLLVKNAEDLWIYIVIQGGIAAIGNASLWLYVPKLLGRPQFRQGYFKENLKATMALFIPQIAIELYVVFDKTMLGLFTSLNQVGYYDKAEQFAKIPLSLLAVISTVMLPRMSNLYNNQNYDEMRERLNENISVVAMLGVAASFGIAGIAHEFVPWMLGSQFQASVQLMILLAPLSVLIGLSNVIGRQYLIPSNQAKIFTLSVVSGAIINISANLVTIPLWGAVGACTATVLAELTVTWIQIYAARKEIHLRKLAAMFLKYVLAGIAMFFAIRIIGARMGAGIITTVMQIVSGIIIYPAFLFFMHDSTMRKVLSQYSRKSG